MKHLVLFAALIRALQVVVALEHDFFENVVIPADIVVALDESIYIKIRNPLESQTECAFKAPGDATFVQLSDDKCGIKIEKVQKFHAGVWRLRSTFKNASFETSIRGVSVVRVKARAKLSPPDNRVFSSDDDFAPQGVDLNYCFVSKTVGSSTLSEIEKKSCSLPTGLAPDYSEGFWNVRVGVEGESREISFSVNIHSTGERERPIKLISRDLHCR
jgi:hypothetical protein